MNHRTNQFLIRAKDVSLIVAILTLLGFVISPMRKIFEIEAMIGRVSKLEDVVASNTNNIAVINAQYADIQKQLEQINWQVRKINR